METTSKTFWQTACELKIGPVPAPVYLVLAVIVAAAIAAPAVRRWAAFQRRKAAARAERGGM